MAEYSLIQITYKITEHAILELEDDYKDNFQNKKARVGNLVKQFSQRLNFKVEDPYQGGSIIYFGESISVS